MGIKDGGKILFHATNIVNRELDSMVDVIISKRQPPVPLTEKKRIDCDVSTIIHTVNKYDYL